MAIPFDQLPIGGGLDPEGNPGASFFIDRNELAMIERDGPEWKYDDARFIEEAVSSPDAIFEGLGRANQDEGLCYSVRLTSDPEEAKEAAGPPRYGYVFVVFVRSGVGGYVVFDWEWREEDEEAGHPLNWQNDFTRRTWHAT